MEVLHATLRAVEAANRPDASQTDLDHLGQLFDQVTYDLRLENDSRRRCMAALNLL